MNPIDKKWYLEGEHNTHIKKVYDLWEFPKEYNVNRVRQFGVPTECYVKDSEVVTPIQGKYWEVDRWFYEGRIVEYAFLQKLPDFKGYGHHTQLYLIELWEDFGDDGHIENEFKGYLLTTDVEKVIKHCRREM